MTYLCHCGRLATRGQPCACIPTDELDAKMWAFLEVILGIDDVNVLGVWADHRCLGPAQEMVN